jgi:hypothetical protein
MQLESNLDWDRNPTNPSIDYEINYYTLYMAIWYSNQKLRYEVVWDDIWEHPIYKKAQRETTRQRRAEEDKREREQFEELKKKYGGK